MKQKRNIEADPQSERIRWLMTGATKANLEQIDLMRSGQTPSLRLLKFGEAARLLDCSRTTIWRAVRDGKLPTVEIREGLFRIPENALRLMVGV